MIDFKPTNPGERMVQQYSPKVMDDGSIVLEESGKMDIYAFIQSFAEQQDVSNIVRRYMNGEIDVLNKVQGQYGDFTTAPKTFAEFQQMRINALALWDSLDVNTRSKFDFDVDKFLSTAGTEEWFSLVQSKKEDVHEKEDDVNADA